MKWNHLVIAMSAMAVASGIGLNSSAAPVYQNDFEVDTTANWTVTKGPAGTDEAHNFFFDYNSVGIPAAPSGAGTHGLKLQANQSSAVFGGVSVSPTGKNFAGDYEVRFDWWANFNGAFPLGGSGSTQLSTFGLDTSGATAQWPGGAQDSIWFAGSGDGNSSSDWRAYSPTAGTSYTAPSGVYAAGTGTSPDARNGSHPYYAGFGSNSAPAAQLGLFPQQTGTTGVGSAGMEWHQVVIAKAGGNVTWTVDGLLIATVPTSHDTVATGNNIFFGHSDTNGSSSTDPNDGALLFTLIDNVQVIPEPGSAALLALAGLGLAFAARRRR